MILGITGTFASGKDTIAHYLEKKGWTHYSTSDVLRDILKYENKEINRDTLVKLGNTLRNEHGNGVLAKMALEKCGLVKNKVISAIRNPGEIEYLRNQNEKFIMIFVDAHIEKRFERTMLRNAERKEDNYNEFKIFKEKEERELNNKDENAQNIFRCKDKFDFIIINDSTLENFYKKIDDLLGDYYE